MSDPNNDILIIGYGNPGRQDDGLGPALAERIERLGLPGVAVDIDYQLTVEHAELAAWYRLVIFVDATTDDGEPFRWMTIDPGPPGIRFSSHHLTPSDVLALTRDLFGAEPQAYLLGIRGRQFGQFESVLSPEAQAALNQALDFLTTRLPTPAHSSQLNAQKAQPCKTEST